MPTKWFAARRSLFAVGAEHCMPGLNLKLRKASFPRSRRILDFRRAPSLEAKRLRIVESRAQAPAT
jgi:hypothetical protein